MRVKRITGDSHFIPLPDHDIDGVVKNPFHQEITQLGHQHVRLWKLANRDRQRPHMVVMTVADRDGIQRFIKNGEAQRPGPQRMAFDSDDPRGDDRSRLLWVLSREHGHRAHAGRIILQDRRLVARALGFVFEFYQNHER